MKSDLYQSITIILILTGIISPISCIPQEKNIISIHPKEIQELDSQAYYNEPYRPQFHFSPEKNWMNDPNGLVYDKGIYHLFYQHHPEDIVWGPMHWGHATSSDLIHWKHHKIALFPDNLGLIFSGSAVVDFQNSSGLGTTENPPMIAIFTYHNMDNEKAGKTNIQNQGLAYSLDDGETWIKYKNNPIIDNAIFKDFRDPKVFWNEENKIWNLILVAGDRALIYSSKNLINWNLESEFGKNAGAHGGVWECPDLFKVKVKGTNEDKWVLTVSLNPGAPHGGSGTQYFVGDFDGKTFKTNQIETKWVDNGADNYAGVTYNNLPENNRISIGWMSNWNYAQITPTTNWRSALTLPRQLSLSKINNNYTLESTPVNQFNNMLIPDYFQDRITLKKGKPLFFSYPNLNQSQITFKASNKNLKMVFSNDFNDSLVIQFDSKNKIFSIDRTKSGNVEFEKSFEKNIHLTSAHNLITENIEFKIILDRSSIEIFLNEGIYVFTEQIFPNKPYTKLKLESSENQTLKQLSLQSVKRIWQSQVVSH